MTPSALDDSVVLAAIATLTTMIMLGLGFLYRPNTATLLWSLMFLTIMISSYLVIIAGATGVPPLVMTAAGLGQGAFALVWSGLRADRGARPYAWTGPLVAAVAIGALVISGYSPLYPLMYSITYVVGAAFAALAVVELMRRPERGGGRLLPLTLVSGLLPIIALAGLLTSVLEFGIAPHTPELPDLKALGLIAYLTCAIVTLLSLARMPNAGGAGGDGEAIDPFGQVALSRLGRAEAAGESGWSLIAISLDDTEALRVAGGEAAYARIRERLEADIRAAFPAEADIGADGPAGWLVLVCRPDSVIRESIRDTLDLISTMEPDQPLSVEFSASVGWASTRAHGYDLQTLTDAAHDAMGRARAAGGHRWERAEVLT